MSIHFLWEKPVLMGILNCTPDSFYAPSRLRGEKDLLSQARKMISEGAEVLDVGGCSTRPDASIPPIEEEWRRLQPALELLRKELPTIPLSIDTFRAEIARRCIEGYAVEVINDVSGGEEGCVLFSETTCRKVAYVLTYNNKDEGNTSSASPLNANEVVEKAKSWFRGKIEKFTSFGVEQIILDLGFGFSKSLEENYLLLSHLEEFKTLGRPILVGVSRKSMIYKVLNSSPEEALNGSTVLHTYALLHGANLLRVHDVRPAREAIEICEKLKKL